jgi:dihydroorotate dehydrogenase (NAD+) catalytic subunit
MIACCDNSESVESSSNLAVNLCPSREPALWLKNPVMPASGTFGYGTEYGDLVAIDRLGAIVTKGISIEPWDGNPQPRLWETASGVLNSIGLENIGAAVALAERAPVWSVWNTPVIVNIVGHTLDEYARVAESLDGVRGVAALELNISCPNITEGGLEFGTNPDMAATVTARVRRATALPLLVKLSPNVTDIAAIARAVVDAGADALSLINTLRGTAIDVRKRVFRLGRQAGGLSGPAIKPVALHMVHRVAHSVTVPIVGCGGVSSAEDALEFIMAGATAVQVGTGTFTNPSTMLAVIDGIAEFVRSERLQNISDVRGIL